MRKGEIKYQPIIKALCIVYVWSFILVPVFAKQPTTPERDLKKYKGRLGTSSSHVRLTKEEIKEILHQSKTIQNSIESRQRLLKEIQDGILEEERKLEGLKTKIGGNAEEIVESQQRIILQEQHLKTLMEQNEEEEKNLNAEIRGLDKEQSAIREKKLKIQQQLREIVHQKQLFDAQNAIIKSRMKEIKRQKMILYVFVGALGAFVLFSAFVLRRILQQKAANKLLNQQNLEIELKNQSLLTQNREIQEQQKLLEQKNNLIHKSIVYAKQIQQTILPSINLLQPVFTDHFVLFRPKDIVSGDFYLIAQKGEKTFFGVIDCTGHGVPGAIMTLLGSKRFQHAIAKFDHPGTILSFVNEEMKQVLRQSSSGGSLRDGMDGVLCVYDSTSRTVHYAGANRPLWIIRDANPTEIEEIKPTRSSLGGKTKEGQDYETHEIALRKNDLLYLFSDGFCDQFSEGNEKMLNYRFKEKLLQIHGLPLKEQWVELDKFLSQWQGDQEQTDDILVLGVRV